MIRVSDVMSPDVRTASPGQSAEAAYETMRARRIHHLAVVQDGDLVGVVTDRDLAGARGAALRRGRVVGDLMTAGAVTVAPDVPVRRAANLMRGRSIGCLVVRDGHRVVGIVTVSDLLESIGRGVERPTEVGRRWTLKHRAPHRKRAGAKGAW